MHSIRHYHWLFERLILTRYIVSMFVEIWIPCKSLSLLSCSLLFLWTVMNTLKPYVTQAWNYTPLINSKFCFDTIKRRKNENGNLEMKREIGRIVFKSRIMMILSVVVWCGWIMFCYIHSVCRWGWKLCKLNFKQILSFWT